jgi:hypothetical protein
MISLHAASPKLCAAIQPPQQNPRIAAFVILVALKCVITYQTEEEKKKLKEEKNKELRKTLTIR